MAAKFRFKLEAVLQQRLRAERDQRLIVAGIQSQLNLVIERAHGIQRDMVVTREAIRADLSPGERVPMQNVRLRAAGSLSGMVELQRLAIEAAGVQQKLNAARAELAKATMKRKAVEMLKEKRLAAYKAEAARREVMELDDLTIMRFGAGKGDGRNVAEGMA